MVYFISLGLGIYFRSSHILSKSSKNWFENRTFRGTKKERVFRTFSFFVMCLLFLYLSGSLKSFIFAFRENYSSLSIQLVVSSWFIIFFIICAEITPHDVE